MFHLIAYSGVKERGRDRGKEAGIQGKRWREGTSETIARQCNLEKDMYKSTDYIVEVLNVRQS